MSVSSETESNVGPVSVEKIYTCTILILLNNFRCLPTWRTKDMRQNQDG